MTALHILALLACFVLLARVVDLFFISSLDKISKDLRLSSDAAGATLMAVGSSAPELFVALFAVLKPGDNEVIGIGSIVGSAIFNLLVIVGAAALVRKAVLTWQPVIRDIIFYAASVALLLWFIWDGMFTMQEAGIFLILYVVYVVAVVYWRRILPYKENHVELEENKEESNGMIGAFDRFLSFFFPKEKYYYRIFFISILIIAGISWILVELAVLISEEMNIPKVIIGLTVMAVGTSIPDLFSSLIVAKQGRGEMAVSNAIGSNIFDILVGLGLPFLLVMGLGSGPIEAGGDLLASSFVLFGSVIVLFLLLLVSRWKVGKITGSILLMLYIAYIAREIIIYSW